MVHDLSKFSPEEFFESVKYYTGKRSPIGVCREANGMSRAWLHHKGRNKHHFEYWYDYNPATHQNEPVKMPMKFVLEMFCDRVAASKVYKGSDYTDSSPLEYYRWRKDYMSIHPETAALLEKLTIMLAEEGEETTFAYIRKELRKKKNY
jgi:hypothetical protein